MASNLTKIRSKGPSSRACASRAKEIAPAARAMQMKHVWSLSSHLKIMQEGGGEVKRFRFFGVRSQGTLRSDDGCRVKFQVEAKKCKSGFACGVGALS